MNLRCEICGAPTDTIESISADGHWVVCDYCIVYRLPREVADWVCGIGASAEAAGIDPQEVLRKMVEEFGRPSLS